MRSKPISPDEILAALEKDAIYGDPGVVAQIRKYILALPEVLADKLDQPVTPLNFFRAKHHFLDWALRNNYYYRLQPTRNNCRSLATWG
ncbi:MAG TPA: hypothetical protein VFT59_04275, partial [Candidatus Saccharimonadales bacterium]|nr:hypothetical protein [Candidatus Saccharimonadales bacterium]